MLEGQECKANLCYMARPVGKRMNQKGSDSKQSWFSPSLTLWNSRKYSVSHCVLSKWVCPLCAHCSLVPVRFLSATLWSPVSQVCVYEGSLQELVHLSALPYYLMLSWKHFFFLLFTLQNIKNWVFPLGWDEEEIWGTRRVPLETAVRMLKMVAMVTHSVIWPVCCCFHLWRRPNGNTCLQLTLPLIIFFPNIKKENIVNKKCLK